MRTSAFDFALPVDRIALRPASPRDAARLLAVRPGGAPELEDRTVRDLPELLQPGDQLVVNDTKVIAASLRGRRVGRGAEPKIEATLIERLDGSRWRALVKGAKSSPGAISCASATKEKCASSGSWTRPWKTRATPGR